MSLINPKNANSKNPTDSSSGQAKPPGSGGAPPPAKPVVAPLFRPIDWLTFGITTLLEIIGYVVTLAPDLTLDDSG